MSDDRPPGFTVIFDPISKSALMHFGDRVVRLPGPFATYQAAQDAARREVSNQTH